VKNLLADIKVSAVDRIKEAGERARFRQSDSLFNGEYWQDNGLIDKEAEDKVVTTNCLLAYNKVKQEIAAKYLEIIDPKRALEEAERNKELPTALEIPVAYRMAKINDAIIDGVRFDGNGCIIYGEDEKSPFPPYQKLKISAEKDAPSEEDRHGEYNPDFVLRKTVFDEASGYYYDSGDFRDSKDEGSLNLPENFVKENLKDGNENYAPGQTVLEFIPRESAREEQRRVEAESPENLKKALEKAKELIAGLKGEFIGVDYGETHGNPYFQGGKVLAAKNGEEEILKRLAFDSCEALYDDSVSHNGYNTCIGDKEIYRQEYRERYKPRDFYSVAGERVTGDDYETFREEVKKMINESYQQRNVEKPSDRKLNPDDLDKIKMYVINNQIKNGKTISAGTFQPESVYGKKGQFSHVFAYDFEAYRKGELVEKKVVTEKISNGFMMLIDKVTVEPNTILLFSGPVSYGRNPSRSEIAYICE
jgi:hypothetical protein